MQGNEAFGRRDSGTGDVDSQHHTVSPKYVCQYVNHAAWIENNRRLDNGALAHSVVGLAMAHPVSRQWKGY